MTKLISDIYLGRAKNAQHDEYMVDTQEEGLFGAVADGNTFFARVEHFRASDTSWACKKY